MTPVSQSTTESLTMKSLILILFVGAAVAQDDIEFSGPKFNFRCPEPNGKFRDPEQCDLYYECEDNEFNALLCDDGLLFDDRDPIQRKKIGFTFGLKNSLRLLLGSVSRSLDISRFCVLFHVKSTNFLMLGEFQDKTCHNSS